MPEITKKQAEKYLETRGASCPKCGGNIEGGELRFEGGEIAQTINCTDYGIEFVDVYRLTAIADADGNTLASIAIEAETV
jgi:hypothetical protein